MCPDLRRYRRSRCQFVQRRLRLRGPQHGHNARSCRRAHKPHNASETVTIYYRFHPLAGTRARKLEHRSHRGDPIVVVADLDGRRHHLPLWMTAPESAQWGLRDSPRLSRLALSELRDLVATVSAEPVLPGTGGRNGIPEVRMAADGTGVRSAAPDQPADGRAAGGGGGTGGIDCRSDGRSVPGIHHHSELDDLL